MKINNYINKLGTVLGVIAAILLSLNISISQYSFILFGISSILWFIYAYNIKEYSLMWMNIFYFIIDLFAVYRWIM
jgi:uncharacterized membrane protein YccC